MNRIDSLFARLKTEGRPAMIAYITGGDPNLAASAKVALAMDQAGVDILELGIPFSDPLADGATIQAAAGRALAAGASVSGILDLIREITDAAEGFIYYVSREGVTGEQSSLASDISERVAAIRALTTVPVAVGFGISTPEQAATVAGVAEGVVVGSAIVRRIGEIGDTPELPSRIADFVRPIAEAVHGAKR